MRGRIFLVFALCALGCSDTGDGEEDDDKTVNTALGAAEMRLNDPLTSAPGGTRSCTAGAVGAYTYFLGAMPSGMNGRDRVRSALLPNGDDFTVECRVREVGDNLTVDLSISGVDANTRRAPASLSLEGTIPIDASASAISDKGSGALSASAFFSADTGNLNADASIAPCVLTVGSFVDGGVLADFSCPVLVDPTSDAAGCQATGTVAFEGCRR